jgi:hypothetical protein
MRKWIAVALAAAVVGGAHAGGKHHEKPWGSYPEEWKEAGHDYFAEWKGEYGAKWKDAHDTFRGGRPTGNASKPLYFRLPGPGTVKVVQTMHWNGGKGAPPGKIFLIGEDGVSHGPWYTNGLPGPGGQPNVIWQVTPIVDLPAGRYQVVDSDPFTWSANGASGGAGMARVGVLPKGGHAAKGGKESLGFMKGW